MSVPVGQIVNLNFDESDEESTCTTLSEQPDSCLSVLEQKKRKLFLGGLKYLTNEEDIRRYFEDELKFETTEIHVNRDKETQKPKHFALVTLKYGEDVDKVLLLPEHKILGRNIEVKRAGRTYLRGMPQAPTKFHPMDPLYDEKPFMNDGEPPKNQRNAARRSKYGFHDYVDEDRRSKKWQETDKGNWNMGKARLDNKYVSLVSNPARKYPKDGVANSSASPSATPSATESDSDRSTRSSRPNRFAGLGQSRLFQGLVKKERKQEVTEE
ncbi:hypothetical protein L596_000609 [Steinernema carpocapsae]|uniref:RRM domain-containing protein n=1 Tax=Steinernema carpocapsae TaxID=34508 RepID=A0A4U8UMU7_STECR|nr:hypothetical protein L596_000609 [Steinernema carpocapsae]